MGLSILKYLNLEYIITNEKNEIIYPVDNHKIKNIKRIISYEHIDNEIYDKENQKWYSYNKQVYEENNHIYQIEIINDITEYKKYTIDYTTKLFNKETIFKQLENILESNSTYSIVIGDIDFFKSFNDTYGHIVGDEVLNQVGKIIDNNITKNSIAGRFGGEEFIIINKEENFDIIFEMIEYIRREISNLNFYFENELIENITMSFGIYHNNDIVISDYDTLKGLLNYTITKADNELYKSKNNGRNQTNYYIEKSV